MPSSNAYLRASLLFCFASTLHSAGATAADRAERDEAAPSGHHAMARNPSLPAGPAPTGPGIQLGDRITTHISGHCFQVGTTPMPGRIDYEWTWQDGVDDAVDGAPNDDPHWVLTRITVAFPNVDAKGC